MRLQAVLFDLHGVFQHFDNKGAAEGERAARLEPGTLAHYAYDHPSYEEAKVGLMSDEEWAEGVTRRLVADFGERARAAVPPWRADRGRRDAAMISLLQQIRTSVPCGILSNFTDAMRRDLDHHGIRADHAFASADLHVTKPSPLAFRAAAERMGVDPAQLYYFDDQPGFVTGARAAGIPAEVFTTPAAVAQRLRRLGVQI